MKHHNPDAALKIENQILHVDLKNGQNVIKRKSLLLKIEIPMLIRFHINRIRGVLVSVLVDRGSGHQSSETNDYEINMYW